MMSKKVVGLLITLLILAVIVISSIVIMHRIEYFRISRIDVLYDKNVGNISNEAKELIELCSDKNIFEVSESRLKKSLLESPCVSKVTITKNYPNELVIELEYQSFKCRLISNDDGVTNYYLASQAGIEEVTEDVFRLYDKLLQVEITSEYGIVIKKWGVDEGFLQMLELASNITQNNLITSVKYDNNKGSGFGHMDFVISGMGIGVSVREPVTSETLNQGIELLLSKDRQELLSQYDLYASGLFGRS